MIEKNGIFIGLVMFFVVVVIGVSFLTSVADTTSSLTDTYTVTNESITHVLGSSDTLTNYPTVTVSAVRNTTDTLTAVTDYNLTDGDAGTLFVGHKSGTLFADYTYRSSSYIDDSASRQITNLIPLFFALAILLGTMGFIAWKTFM